MTEIKPYVPTDAIELCGDPDKLELAKFNLSGPCYSLFIDGKLVASGGIRFGVGEAWFIMGKDRDASPNFTSEKKVIIKSCRQKIEDMMREHGLWKLYAEPEMSKVFIKALGFKAQPTFVR